MKFLKITSLLLIVSIFGCVNQPEVRVEEGVSITKVELGDRNIMIAESVDTRLGLIWLGCGEQLTEGLCHKCIRGQISDMSNNRPLRDCNTACKTKDCKAPTYQGDKVFVLKK